MGRFGLDIQGPLNVTTSGADLSSTKTTTQGTAEVSLIASACLTESECVGNRHYWWQQGMFGQWACHEYPPQNWWETGPNQVMLTGAVVGITLAGFVVWYVMSKR